MARDFENCKPIPGKDCYLYRIKLVLTKEFNDVNKTTFKPEESSRTLAILTAKRLPSFPRFPIYARAGELLVDIYPHPIKTVLNEQQLLDVKKFHRYIFKEILRLEKLPLFFQPENSAHNYYIVIMLNDSPTIDMDFISFITYQTDGEIPSKKKKYSIEELADAVLAPTYRSYDQPQRFYVTEVRKDMTPLSPFPSKEYENFAAYYIEKYRLDIRDKSQPLVEVEYATGRLNLLIPRHVNRHGQKLNASEREKEYSSRQFLVPELCQIFPVPSSLWQQIVCLPSILHRLNQIMVADELRQLVANNAGVGKVELPSSFRQRDFDFGWKQLPEKCHALEKLNDSNESFEPHQNEDPATIDPCDLNGPSPVDLLQALTTSKASDGFNLERLEMLGDSFLKQSVTSYLFCNYPAIHEGKLSFLRSKQVSNRNLYKLGRRFGLPSRIFSTAFDPPTNWLPPGYVVNIKALGSEWDNDDNATFGEEIAALNIISVGMSENWDFKIGTWDTVQNMQGWGDGITDCGTTQWGEPEDIVSSGWDDPNISGWNPDKGVLISDIKENDAKANEFADILRDLNADVQDYKIDDSYGFKGACPQLEHTVSDKAIADTVEALIGCYLTTCGERAALQFMNYIGIKVIPGYSIWQPLTLPSIQLYTRGKSEQHVKEKFSSMLSGTENFEKKIGYNFKNKEYLLQALTHPSYYLNDLTDCYQRLEFLGDAVLDYLITKHLYHDKMQHSPGELTDLRSALVNNAIFATLAIEYDFHKYLKHLSPMLHHAIDKYLHYIKSVVQPNDEEDDYDSENEDEDDQDLEVPKPLGDIFESIAGAIYLDSDMSLNTVWSVYYPMMESVINTYSTKVPVSPVRELLELEPETTKFGVPVKNLTGKYRVTVTITGKGIFHGMGRNYKIAKAAAARRALRKIKCL